MTAKKIVGFVQSLVNLWDQRTGACLGRLVYALLQSRRLGVAALGRYRPTKTTTKHHIKAVDRFLGNPTMDLSLLFGSFLLFLCPGLSRVFVLLDWTDLHDGEHEVLVAAISFGGRSLPIAWSTWKKGHYLRSRNKVESTLCALVQSLLPSSTELCIVADRGFGRASFLKALSRLGISYVIRFKKDIHLLSEKGERILPCLHRGQTRDLPSVFFGRQAQWSARCILTWGRSGNKAYPKEPWFLVTNLSPEALCAHHVVFAYRRRMRIEHAFRDHKSFRFGFALRHLTLSSAKRYDHVLAISTLALLILMLLGKKAEALGIAKTFRANTVKTRTHSLFLLGLFLLHRLKLYRVPISMKALCLEDSLPGIP